MKKPELTLILISILAVILKLFHVPGGSVLATLSISILSVLYVFFGFAILNGIGLREFFKRDSYKKLTAIRIIGTIMLGFFIAIALIGILFKLQHWPSAEVNLTAGVIGISIGFVVAVVKYFMTRATFYLWIIFRCLFFGGIAAALHFLPL